MGKKHPFYRVNLGERNKQCIQKPKKNFTSSNIIETQKPTSRHGKFKPKWQDRRNQFPPGKVTDIKRSNIIHQSTWWNRKKILHKEFKITDYYRDNKLNIKMLETSLLPGLLHIYATNENFGINERLICTIKERKRATCHTVQFKRYTIIMKW